MFKTVYLINETLGQTLVLSEDSDIDSNHVLEDIDWGTVEAKHKSVQYTDMIGSQQTNTVIGTRDISINGCLVAQSQLHMNQLKAVLNKFVNPLNWLDLHYDVYALKFKPDKSVRYAKSVLENNEILCRFLIMGECFDPLFKLINSEVVVMQSNQPVPLFPLHSRITTGFIFGIVSTATFKKVPNAGDVETGVLIVLKIVGAVVTPKVTNQRTGYFVVIDGAFQDGDIVEISTILGKKTVILKRGGVTTNIFNDVTLDSNFFTLLPGDNNIEVSAVENVSNIRMSITSSPRFMEVQTTW